MELIFRLLKRTGLGALYLVTSPLLAFAFVVFLIYGLLTFIAVTFKSIYLFFSGRGVFTPFPEDLVAQKRYQFMQKQTPPTHKGEVTQP
jgi:predicted membrane metal-binding protein